MAYSMKLADLVALVGVSSNNELVVSSLSIDSREIAPGALFLAYPGDAADGRNYIAQAQQAGAAAVLYEPEDFELPKDLSIDAFPVSGLRHQVGHLAHEFYGQPSGDLQVFGVTGTNGKTTCCFLLAQALTELGLQAAMIGTIGVGKIGALDTAAQTTPDPISVHRRLAEFREQGITQVCMEVSSHALDQGRVNGVQFFCSLFTNLSHDHLDYHGDMSSYAAAKRRLFTDFASELVVTNAADEMGRSLVDVANAEFIVQYGESGDVYADDVVLSEHGINLVIEGAGVEFEITTPLIGQVNIPNIELLVAALLGLSTPVEQIQTIVAKLQPAPGRMELVSSEGKPSVVIDYAHTPDALEKALISVRQHCTGQLWCVFGCGGDRDAAKRPVMGGAAARCADVLIVTNDNPRSEKGADIAAEIQCGIEGESKVILDRAEAISWAVSNAANTDWVLVAGKGHETTQQIGDVRHPFSDREQVAKAMGVAA